MTRAPTIRVNVNMNGTTRQSGPRGTIATMFTRATTEAR